MGLSTRLTRLEQRQPVRRCATCRDWPDARVAYDPPGSGPEPAIPECCPVCGWEPVLIDVRHIDGDDWRDR